jgi:hypothetical protein
MPTLSTVASAAFTTARRLVIPRGRWLRMFPDAHPHYRWSTRHVHSSEKNSYASRAPVRKNEPLPAWTASAALTRAISGSAWGSTAGTAGEPACQKTRREHQGLRAAVHTVGSGSERRSRGDPSSVRRRMCRLPGETPRPRDRTQEGRGLRKSEPKARLGAATRRRRNSRRAAPGWCRAGCRWFAISPSTSIGTGGRRARNLRGATAKSNTGTTGANRGEPNSTRSGSTRILTMIERLTFARFRHVC